MQPVAIRQRTRPVQGPPMPNAKTVRWAFAPDAMEVDMGIDPSLTATGVSVLWRDQIQTFVISPKEKGPARLAVFRAEFTRIFQIYRPRTLAIEGYAFASKFSRAHDLGELGGVLRLAAHDCRLRTIIAPPNVLKMFATGKGNVGKEVVIKEAFKRWGIDVSDNNEADAGVLSLMAASYTAPTNLTEFQKTAMTKVEVMR